MKKGQVTLKDIARELNVSASTVSRALKNHPGLNKETINVVQDLAKKLNYHPNLLALSLLPKKNYRNYNSRNNKPFLFIYNYRHT